MRVRPHLGTEVEKGVLNEFNAVADANKMARDHLHLVGKAVAQVSARYPRHVDRDELWSAGALGLVEAARRFDHEAGIPFPHYAMIRIRGAIIDSTRSRDWASRSVRRRARDLEHAKEALRSRGQEPSDSSIADMLDITVASLDEIRSRAQTATLLYLDYEDGDDSGSLRDRVVDVDLNAIPSAALEQKEMLGTLRSAVNILKDQHREVISRYYLDGELLQDVADDMGITEARVSQIRSEALVSLRAYLGTLYEGVPEADEDAPGKRARAAYLARAAAQTTWLSRLTAVEMGFFACLGEPGKCRTHLIEESLDPRDRIADRKLEVASLVENAIGLGLRRLQHLCGTIAGLLDHRLGVMVRFVADALAVPDGFASGLVTVFGSLIAELDRFLLSPGADGVAVLLCLLENLIAHFDGAGQRRPNGLRGLLRLGDQTLHVLFYLFQLDVLLCVHPPIPVWFSSNEVRRLPAALLPVHRSLPDAHRAILAPNVENRAHSHHRWHASSLVTWARLKRSSVWCWQVARASGCTP